MTTSFFEFYDDKSESYISNRKFMEKQFCFSKDGEGVKKMENIGKGAHGSVYVDRRRDLLVKKTSENAQQEWMNLNRVYECLVKFLPKEYLLTPLGVCQNPTTNTWFLSFYNVGDLTLHQFIEKRKHTTITERQGIEFLLQIAIQWYLLSTCNILHADFKYFNNACVKANLNGKKFSFKISRNKTITFIPVYILFFIDYGACAFDDVDYVDFIRKIYAFRELIEDFFKAFSATRKKCLNLLDPLYEVIFSEYEYCSRPRKTNVDDWHKLFREFIMNLYELMKNT